MFQLVFTLCCLVVSLSATPVDVKKTLPKLPNAYTMTLVATDTDNAEGRKTTVQFWYDGEEGELKTALEDEDNNGETIKIVEYSFNDFEGKPAEFYIDNEGQCHRLFDEGVLGYETARNPLAIPSNAQFLEEQDVNGDKVEKWQFSMEGNEDIVVHAYYKIKEGAAIPLLFERYDTEGSDLVLASVAEIKEFTASKPDASTFQLDASKCKEYSPERTFFQKFK